MSLASLVDKPLIQNPLAGGGQLGGLTFRQEGDMGRYVADNDPGGIAAGFSNLQDYLAAGNKLPEQQVSLKVAGSNANMPKILGDPLRPRSDDPLMQGFFDSEFYSPRSTTNVVNYKFRGKDMQGSGSQASDLKKYLESIGQGNLIELSNESIAQQGSGPLTTIGGSTPPPGLGTPMNPFMGQIDTPEQLIESGQFTPNPMQTGDQGLMDRLTSLEQGIGSLQNQIASLFQMGQASDPFGLGGFINTRRY